MDTNRNKRKRSSALFWILLVLALCGLVFSGYKVISILLEYRKAQDTYQRIETDAFGTKTPDSREFQPDFVKLKQENPDCVAWLFCDGVLSYPVVKGTDNEYYLNHLFDGTENPGGTIFMDASNNGPEDANCILYGHNMKDGSMFGALYQYDDEAFYKEHPVYDLYTETNHYRYEVISACRTPVTGPVYQIQFASEAAFLDTKKELALHCPYATAAEISGNSAPLLTLSTCTYDSSDTDRYVVVLQRSKEEKKD